jgi:hypothetical protein
LAVAFDGDGAVGLDGEAAAVDVDDGVLFMDVDTGIRGRSCVVALRH